MKVTGEKYHGTYGAARFVAYLSSFVGWISIIGGAILVFVGLGVATQSPMGMFGVAGGASLVIGGLIQVALSQGVRAAADTADYARQSFMLQVAQAKGLAEVELSRTYIPAPVRAPVRRDAPRPHAANAGGVPAPGSIDEHAFVELEPSIARSYLRALEKDQRLAEADMLKNAWSKTHQKALFA
jgi:hypothetical protein